MISVVIPHKDSTASLRVLLKSVPRREELEVIVVDDGSRAETSAFKLREEFPWVQFATNDRRSAGAGAARNVGLDLARREWLVFADADDRFHEAALDILVECLKKTKSEIVFFQCSGALTDCGLEQRRVQEHNAAIERLETFGDDTALRYRCLTPWGRALRRSLIVGNEITFDETLVSNDVMFALRSGWAAHSVSARKMRAYHVDLRPGSLSHKLTPSKALTRLDVALDYNQFVKRYSLSVAPYMGLKYFLISLGAPGVSMKWKVYKKFVAGLPSAVLGRVMAK